MLRLAYDTFSSRTYKDSRKNAFLEFCNNNKKWLSDYADFMAIKELHNHKPWPHWEPFFLDHSSWILQRDKLIKKHPDLEKSIGFYKYIQFCFFNQWKALKKYSE
ncbi:MAG: 4-alpha-glucanotransferase, partial [Candidatus Theseobacter exili]|nr:4-alpha-glucanotransferase [Candidatus Theseobacter exili]